MSRFPQLASSPGFKDTSVFKLYRDKEQIDSEVEKTITFASEAARRVMSTTWVRIDSIFWNHVERQVDQ